MKRYIHIVAAVLLLACAGAAYFAWGRGLRLPPNTDGRLTSIPLAKGFHHIPTKEHIESVSLAEYDEGRFVTAGYADMLRLVNVHTGETRHIAPENLDGCEAVNGTEATPNRKIWNPTGVYFHRRSKLLYIANYTGHNILIGRITDRGTFAAEKMIVAKGLVSPENIVVNEAGSRIAVADYDGNSVFLFDGEGHVLWRKDVPLAHGVEISDSSVYCTSLATREIIRFDLEGKEIGRVGHQANSGIQAYLWPTALELYKGKLIVADPHTGRLTVLDENLEYETALGSNGPYATNFNYPYAAIVAENSLWVADTFNLRLLQMDLQGNLLAQVSRREPRMQPEGQSPYVPFYPYADAYLYEETELPASFFDERYEGNKKVFAGFSSFWLVQDNDKVQIPLVDYPSDVPNLWMTRFFCNYFYAAWSHRAKTSNHEYYILGSPQANRCLFYCVDADFGGIVRLWNPNNSWVQGEFIGNKEEWDAMLHDMDSLTDDFISNGDASQTRYAAYTDTFARYFSKLEGRTATAFSKEDMESWLEFQCSQSEAGAAFYKEVRQGRSSVDDYQNYVEACYREPNKHSVFERLLLRTFAGAQNE